MYCGCLKEKSDKRDYKLKKISKSPLLLDEYKLNLAKIKDQGIVNSCVAHSLSSLLESLYTDKTFSTGFIYGYRPFGYFQGEGMYPREALKTIQKIGDVEEKEFSHNKEMTDIKTLVDNQLNDLKELAKSNKIESYARIYTETEIKTCLYNNIPVPVSIPVKGNLELDENNIIQITTKEITGYHMMLLYGWNEFGYLVQNSWGKYWGDNGTAILPYEYEIDSAWAIKPKDSNLIDTYQTIWQKIYNFLLRILNWFKK